MTDTSDRLDAVEKGLDAVGAEVKKLRGEVGELRGDVGELRGEVGGLRGEVHGLRVLEEDNSRRITVLAEVQTDHGARLERIEKAVEPIREIRDFIRLVAADHERRITALERRGGADNSHIG